MQPLVPDTCFHIFNHANGFENVFSEAENYRFFLEKYQLYISPIAETYAHCLLPNHFHLVVRIRKREAIEKLIQNKNNSLAITSSKVQNFGRVTDNEIEKFLSKQFANLFSSYTQSYNKVYHRMGSLFIKNFKRESISDKTHFLNAITYTHRNPIHHRFCKGFEEWTYSSYPGIIYRVERIVETEKLLKITGGIDAFINMHKINLDSFESLTYMDIPYSYVQSTYKIILRKDKV
jgi:REP element-mobilizing transposase RayT